jgi:cell division protein FtsQ
MQQVAPRSGRTSPGMPPDFDDPDDDREPLPGRRRFGSQRNQDPRGRWYWPAGKAGRIFLAACAVLVLCTFTLAGLTLKHFLDRDARFRIAGSENIEATGLTEVTRAQLLPVFGEDIGRNVFFVPLNARRKQLEQIPWIERATVMRLLPDQIRVSVVERKPVAFTRHGQQIGLVDADGVLLGMSAGTMASRHYSFPVVTGIDPGDPPAARKARMEMYQHMMSELDADGKHNSEQISEIDLTDPEDARVLMPEQGTDILAHFGEDHFLERYQRFQAHIAEWRQQYPHLASVDLRYDNQVVLQMASGKEASDTSAGPDAAGATSNGMSSGATSGTPAASADQTNAAKPQAGAPSAKKIRPAAKKKHAVMKRAAIKTSRRNPATPAKPAAGVPAQASQEGGQ